jgi:hypothetical protein
MRTVSPPVQQIMTGANPLPRGVAASGMGWRSSTVATSSAREPFVPRFTALHRPQARTTAEFMRACRHPLHHKSSLTKRPPISERSIRLRRVTVSGACMVSVPLAFRESAEGDETH